MPNIRQRSIKEAPLTQAEVDANDVTQVTAKVASDTVDKNANNDTWECTITSGTITLPAVSVITDPTNAAGSETGEFTITIKNLDPTDLTIALNGSDEIDGVAASITLVQNVSVTLQSNHAGDGWNRLGGNDVGEYVPTSDFNSGSETVLTVTNGGQKLVAISHGLGTENYDMGCSVQGVSSANAFEVGAMMITSENYLMDTGQQYNYSSIATPASGTTNIYVSNSSASQQNIVVRWWVRKRA